MMLVIFWFALLEGMLDAMVDHYWQREYARLVATVR